MFNAYAGLYSYYQTGCFEKHSISRLSISNVCTYSGERRDVSVTLVRTTRFYVKF